MDLTLRAISAFYRSDRKTAVLGGGPESPNGMREHDGRRYVVLRDHESALLAVYRVRTSGALKRLRRWPWQVVAAE